MTTDKYTIFRVSANKLYENDHLFSPHYNEVAKNKEVMILNPDYKKYFTLEGLDKLLIFGVFFKGQLVGYSLNIVDTNLHYAGLKVCQNDLLFLLPEHRASTAGLRLIKITETFAKAHGCKLMLWHAKENSALDKVLQAKHYPIQDIIRSKQL